MFVGKIFWSDSINGEKMSTMRIFNIRFIDMKPEFLINTVLFHFAPKSGWINIKLLCRCAPIIIILLQN